jgi:hypothetical protein
MTLVLSTSRFFRYNLLMMEASPALIAESDPTHRGRLERLAARYVWWTPPARTVDENMPRLVAAVMEMGTWEDANEMEDLVGPDVISSVLDAPPPGVLSMKSLTYWHARLDRHGDPAPHRSRFG